MLFQSFPYLLCFLPVVVIVHSLLSDAAGWRAAQVWLLVSSMFFYGYYHLSTLPLLLGSIAFNWAAARIMMATTGETPRKRILQAALAANILFLCYFKYANFLLSMLPFGLHIVLPERSLPLGISFFTLTQVMFLVDTYQGLNGPNSLLDHSTLVALFPYVTSGPLVRCRTTVPQFHKWALNESRVDAISRGLYLFSIGLAKKVVLADSFANIADAGFHSASSVSTVEAWLATIAYSFQIYFDFSGYSDMAVASARMLGIEIPQNFNAPYRAKSIFEYWQRWHISLSNFITNYLYTPMLRSMGKATIWTSAVATILAMSIAGLWHGAAWTFVIFGLLHGIGLSLNQIWKKKKPAKVPDWLGWIMTMLLVDVAFVFFRSPGVVDAFHFLNRMFLLEGNVVGYSILAPVLPLTPMLVLRPIVLGVILAFAFKSSAQLEKAFIPRPLTAAATAALILISMFYMNSASAKPFLYFAF